MFHAGGSVNGGYDHMSHSELGLSNNGRSDIEDDDDEEWKEQHNESQPSVTFKGIPDDDKGVCI